MTMGETLKLFVSMAVRRFRAIHGMRFWMMRVPATDVRVMRQAALGKCNKQDHRENEYSAKNHPENATAGFPHQLIPFSR